MEKVSPSVYLILIQLRDEMEMYLGGLASRGPLAIVGVSRLAESLPSAELLALGGIL